MNRRQENLTENVLCTLNQVMVSDGGNFIFHVEFAMGMFTPPSTAQMAVDTVKSDFQSPPVSF